MFLEPYDYTTTVQSSTNRMSEVSTSVQNTTINTSFNFFQTETTVKHQSSSTDSTSVEDSSTSNTPFYVIITVIFILVCLILISSLFILIKTVKIERSIKRLIRSPIYTGSFISNESEITNI